MTTQGQHRARLVALGTDADAALGYARHDGFEAQMIAALAQMIQADDDGGDPVETCIDDILCAVSDYAVIRGQDGYYRLIWDGDGRGDVALVAAIRATCATEFDMPETSEFFSVNYRDGETPDSALLRLFHAEREHHGSDHGTVLALCHG